METAATLKEKYIKKEVQDKVSIGIQYNPSDFIWPVFPDEEVEFEGAEVIHFMVRMKKDPLL